MTPLHKQVMKKTLVHSALINAVLNGGFAWMVVYKTGEISVQGAHGTVMFDFILTGVLLGFLLALLSAPSKVKKAIAEGLQSLNAYELGIAAKLPRSHFYSALIMAVVGFFVAGIVLFILVLLGVETMNSASFISTKIVFAVLLAILVEYLITLKCWRHEFIAGN